MEPSRWPRLGQVHGRQRGASAGHAARAARSSPAGAWDDSGLEFCLYDICLTSSISCQLWGGFCEVTSFCVAGSLSGPQHRRICPAKLSLSLGMDIPPRLWADVTVLTHPHSNFYSFCCTVIPCCNMQPLSLVFSCAKTFRRVWLRLLCITCSHSQALLHCRAPANSSCRDEGLAHQFWHFTDVKLLSVARVRMSVSFLQRAPT